VTPVIKLVSLSHSWVGALHLVCEALWRDC